MSASSIPAQLRRAIWERDGDRCCYCGLRQTGQAATFHIDHVVPRSRGGATELDHLALQCPSCSLHKADRIDAVDPETGQSTRLFHPLRDVWTEHYQSRSDGTIFGRTPIGRATIEALQMNGSLPRTARALQHALGLIAPDAPSSG